VSGSAYNKKDRWWQLKSGEMACVMKEDMEVLLCRVVPETQSENFFTSPRESKLLDIWYVKSKHMHRVKTVTEQAICHRVVCFPYNEGQVLFPVLHDVERY